MYCFICVPADLLLYLKGPFVAPWSPRVCEVETVFPSLAFFPVLLAAPGKPGPLWLIPILPRACPPLPASGGLSTQEVALSQWPLVRFLMQPSFTVDPKPQLVQWRSHGPRGEITFIQS